jgi:hypothetical protein
METSLIADAQRFYPQTTSIDDVVALYERMHEQYSKKAGYPRLYLEAWRLLITLIKEDRLCEIDTVLDSGVTIEDGAFSLWHLKSYLYLWSHYNRDNAERLLRLLRDRRLFINMTPDEAHQHLVTSLLAHKSNVKPYLFRLSTTVPGLITLSYIGPVKNTTYHRRITDPELVYRLMNQDFYETLLGSPRSEMCDINVMKEMMRQIDVDAPLEKLVKEVDNRQFEYINVFPRLKSIYFDKARPMLLVPVTNDEMMGVTSSYIDSYRLESNVSQCFHCHSPHLKYKDNINNSFYCSDQCYQLDYNKCY